MRSAADFLPLFITTFMNFASMSLLNFGSGRMRRTGACARRDMLAPGLISTCLYGCDAARLARRPAAPRDSDHFFGRLAPYFERLCLRVVDAGAVERAAHGVVTHAGEVLDAAAADEHHRVLLQVVAFAADVGGDFVAVGQADARDLAERGVRLLRRRRVDAGAHAALLRGSAQRGHLRFLGASGAGRGSADLSWPCNLQLLVVHLHRRPPGTKPMGRQTAQNAPGRRGRSQGPPKHPATRPFPRGGAERERTRAYDRQPHDRLRRAALVVPDDRAALQMGAARSR